MEERITNLENRMDRVEKVIKLTPIKPSIKVKCEKCGHSINTRSELKLISCPNCGGKTKNTSLKEKEPEPWKDKNAFEGKRYKDYDDLNMQKIIFKNKQFVKCDFCPKKLKIYEGFWGFNYLLCKNCYIKICKSNDKAVNEISEEFL